MKVGLYVAQCLVAVPHIHILGNQKLADWNFQALARYKFRPIKLKTTMNPEEP